MPSSVYCWLLIGSLIRAASVPNELITSHRLNIIIIVAILCWNFFNTIFVTIHILRWNTIEFEIICILCFWRIRFSLLSLFPHREPSLFWGISVTKTFPCCSPRPGRRVCQSGNKQRAKYTDDPSPCFSCLYIPKFVLCRPAWQCHVDALHTIKHIYRVIFFNWYPPKKF